MPIELVFPGGKRPYAGEGNFFKPPVLDLLASFCTDCLRVAGVHSHELKKRTLLLCCCVLLLCPRASAEF